jgi:hypothetical protein
LLAIHLDARESSPSIVFLCSSAQEKKNLTDERARYNEQRMTAMDQ